MIGIGGTGCKARYRARWGIRQDHPGATEKGVSLCCSMELEKRRHLDWRISYVD